LSDQHKKFTVDSRGAERLDKFLVSQISEQSRARLQDLIKSEKVTVDGKVVTKTGLTLEVGQVVEVCLPEPVPSGLIPEDIPLDILYENDDLAVINKPAGMVVHPAAGHATGTLVQQLWQRSLICRGSTVKSARELCIVWIKRLPV